MKRIFEDEVLFKDAAVFGDDKEHAYQLDCYDGWAIGVALRNDDDDAEVPAEIIVRYPRLRAVLDSETMTRHTLEYRGLGNDPSVIHYGDIMMAFGKIDAREMIVSVTAHISDEPCMENSMELFGRTFKHRYDVFSKIADPFLGYLEATFPMLNWVFDDGDDNYGSDYVQYAAYTEGDKSNNYVLAVFLTVDE